MGACLSCLGLNRRDGDSDPSEAERLLYEPPDEYTQYGTVNSGLRSASPDPDDTQKRREMLARLCAETANDLIDVQSTDLPTLHGKPSFEFANLLNKHYDNETNGKISHKQQNMEDSHISTTSHEEPTTLDIPTTPVLNNHNVFGRLQDDNNEPPSPFTQAQLQAAEKLLNTQSQNQQTISSNRSTHEFDSRRTSSALSKTHPESNHIDGLISSTERRTSKETNGDRRETAHQMPEKKDDEDEDEDAWLASVVNGDDVTEIKGLSDVKYRFPDAEGFASDKHGTTTTKKSRAL